MPVMLSTGEDMCPHSVCQASPNSPQVAPSSTSDLDSDDKTSVNGAWAGIAVVIVVVFVTLVVWYALRRRKRARGGRNSVDAGGGSKQLSAFGAFWSRLFGAKPPRQSVVERDIELQEDGEVKQGRPSSSASNLKRTTTSITADTDGSHVAKLDVAGKEPGLYPEAADPDQSLETVAPVLPRPSPSPSTSQTPRASSPAPSSTRSSLSRLSIPPPGLGPPTPAYAQSPTLATAPPLRPAS